MKNNYQKLIHIIFLLSTTFSLFAQSDLKSQETLKNKRPVVNFIPLEGKQYAVCRDVAAALNKGQVRYIEGRNVFDKGIPLIKNLNWVDLEVDTKSEIDLLLAEVEQLKVRWRKNVGPDIKDAEFNNNHPRRYLFSYINYFKQHNVKAKTARIPIPAFGTSVQLSYMIYPATDFKSRGNTVNTEHIGRYFFSSDTLLPLKTFTPTSQTFFLHDGMPYRMSNIGSRYGEGLDIVSFIIITENQDLFRNPVCALQDSNNKQN